MQGKDLGKKNCKYDREEEDKIGRIFEKNIYDYLSYKLDFEEIIDLFDYPKEKRILKFYQFKCLQISKEELKNKNPKIFELNKSKDEDEINNYLNLDEVDKFLEEIYIAEIESQIKHQEKINFEIKNHRRKKDDLIKSKAEEIPNSDLQTSKDENLTASPEKSHASICENENNSVDKKEESKIESSPVLKGKLNHQNELHIKKEKNLKSHDSFQAVEDEIKLMENEDYIQYNNIYSEKPDAQFILNCKFCHSFPFYYNVIENIFTFQSNQENSENLMKVLYTTNEESLSLNLSEFEKFNNQSNQSLSNIANDLSRIYLDEKNNNDKLSNPNLFFDKTNNSKYEEKKNLCNKTESQQEESSIIKSAAEQPNKKKVNKINSLIDVLSKKIIFQLKGKELFSLKLLRNFTKPQKIKQNQKKSNNVLNIEIKNSKIKDHLNKEQNNLSSDLYKPLSENNSINLYQKESNIMHKNTTSETPQEKNQKQTVMFIITFDPTDDNKYYFFYMIFQSFEQESDGVFKIGNTTRKNPNFSENIKMVFYKNLWTCFENEYIINKMGLTKDKTINNLCATLNQDTMVFLEVKNNVEIFKIIYQIDRCTSLLENYARKGKYNILAVFAVSNKKNLQDKDFQEKWLHNLEILAKKNISLVFLNIPGNEFEGYDVKKEPIDFKKEQEEIIRQEKLNETINKIEIDMRMKIELEYSEKLKKAQEELKSKEEEIEKLKKKIQLMQKQDE